MKAIQIAPSTYWVGVIDWALRDFHGYETSRGSTYNAYLVRAKEGYVLIDGVKRGFEAEFLERISSVCDPKEIHSVISNHAEMDHSGSFSDMMKLFAPDCKLYASPMGVKALHAHFGDEFPVSVVENGTHLILGGSRFDFVETRMLHWPDSMFTYFGDDAILFTNDAFGMHFASNERWYDECDLSILDQEAQKYYANIITPFSGIVAKLCANLPPYKIEIIAPDHGVLWRGDGITRILDHYKRWSDKDQTPRRALIIYDTMWNSTEHLAMRIAEGILQKGLHCDVMPIYATHRSDIAMALLAADTLIVGSPTLNQGMLPRVADVLCYLKGLKFNIRTAAAFGSYGWAPLGTKAVQEQLCCMCKNTLDSYVVNYVPTSEALNNAVAYGHQIAAEMLK